MLVSGVLVIMVVLALSGRSIWSWHCFAGYCLAKRLIPGLLIGPSTARAMKKKKKKKKGRWRCPVPSAGNQVAGDFEWC